MRFFGTKLVLSTIILALGCTSALGDDWISSGQWVGTIPTEKPKEKTRDVGHDAYVEADLQAGIFSGVRAKGIVASSDESSLAVEGMLGWSAFDTAFATTYGAGVRGEFSFGSNHKTSTWMISPGIDGYYIPPNRYQNSNGNDVGGAISNAFASVFDVPTRATLISPNADLSYLFQAFTVGLKLGAAVGLNGTDLNGHNVAGKLVPDAGLYVGFRL